MEELLSLLGTVTYFGVRQKGDFLMLTTMVVAGATTLRALDFLIVDVAAKADEVEEGLTKGKDRF
jgi:hypothetical protein